MKDVEHIESLSQPSSLLNVHAVQKSCQYLSQRNLIPEIAHRNTLDDLLAPPILMSSHHNSQYNNNYRQQ